MTTANSTHSAEPTRRDFLYIATGAADFIKLFHERASAAKLPDTAVEVQAAASYTAWQILEAGVQGTKSLDDKAIGAWLRGNRVNTLQGSLRFNGPGQYGDDLMRVKQIQNGTWKVVWPKAFAAPGATVQAN